MAREKTRRTTKRKTTRTKVKTVDSVKAVVSEPKTKKESESRYSLRYTGVNPSCMGFDQGVWYPVPDDRAARCADKHAFDVRDNVSGSIVSKDDIEKGDDTDLSRSERVALRKERMKKEVGTGSLKADHKKNTVFDANNIPHDPDYVSKEIDDTGDLPPAGVPVGENGEMPRHVIKSPRSQRMTDADTSALRDSRLDPTEAAAQHFDPNAGIAEVQTKLNAMRIPPARR